MLLLGLVWGSAAQTRKFSGVEFDRTVHDWGDITLSDGPQQCVFKASNTSSKPWRITSVVSSCGCTGVSWTKGDVAPGENAEIRATYSNDEGTSAFDKTLTVYMSNLSKPVVLHLRGMVSETKRPLSETFPAHALEAGFRSFSIKAGNMTQGGPRSGEFLVAGISGRERVNVSFESKSPQLEFTPQSVSVASGETVRVAYTLNPSRELWGRNTYRASISVDGRGSGRELEIWAVTKEDFSGLGKDELASAPVASSNPSSVSRSVGGEEQFKASFTISNEGKAPLRVYRVETNNPERVKSLQDNIPELNAGESFTLDFLVNCRGLDFGEDNLMIVSLYTNSPKRSVLNLFILPEK